MLEARSRFGAYSPRPFEPAWWLPGPHAQTMVGRLLRSLSRVSYRRRRVETPDDDFLDLDLLLPAGRKPRAAVVLLHGLEGSSASGYMVELARRLREANIAAVAMNFRSCSGQPNRRPRFYHSGETGDVDFVIDWVRRTFPDLPVGAVGFSMGGNVLLKYLGEDPSRARRKVTAAAAASVPFDLREGSTTLRGSLGRVYDRYFVRSLVEKVRRKQARHGFDFDLDRLEEIDSLYAFDQAYTAPLHGFEDAGDYYEKSSCTQFLPDVPVPTLLVQARDDVFYPEEALPLDAIRHNDYLMEALSSRGGHLGFVEGPFPGAHRFWVEAEMVRFLQTLLPD